MPSYSFVFTFHSFGGLFLRRSLSFHSTGKLRGSPLDVSPWMLEPKVTEATPGRTMGSWLHYPSAHNSAYTYVIFMGVGYTYIIHMSSEIQERHRRSQVEWKSEWILILSTCDRRCRPWISELLWHYLVEYLQLSMPVQGESTDTTVKNITRHYPSDDFLVDFLLMAIKQL